MLILKIELHFKARGKLTLHALGYFIKKGGGEQNCAPKKSMRVGITVMLCNASGGLSHRKRCKVSGALYYKKRCNVSGAQSHRNLCEACGALSLSLHCSSQHTKPILPDSHDTLY